MLEIRNLTLGYGQEDVLHDVSYTFTPGKIYTIVGQNGCGKSTLLKSCVGLLESKPGTIIFEGKELEAYKYEERARKIAYLSQSRNTPGIAVERLVMHGRHPHLPYPKKMRQLDWDIVNKALFTMNIDHMRKKLVTELSGGERQRVYLAMQFVQDTPYMLLDEPTTYMDIQYQLSFLEHLADLKAQGKTIIMVLHDLEHALLYSDELVVMKEGEIVGSGSPEEIVESGILGDVFQIEAKRLKDEKGKWVYFFRQKRQNTL